MHVSSITNLDYIKRILLEHSWEFVFRLKGYSRIFSNKLNRIKMELKFYSFRICVSKCRH